MNPIPARLKSLRLFLKTQGAHAVIIPTADPHLCEYSPVHWSLRAFLSGFSGSAGTLVVTHEDAQLWTDFRYWIAAEQQLEGTGIGLQKQGSPEVKGYSEWLQDHLKKGQLCLIDPMMISAKGYDTLSIALGKKGIHLSAQNGLCETLWNERPSAPNGKVKDYPVRYAGLTRTRKLTALREKLTHGGIQYHLISTLPDIAWLLNLRGTDTPCTPLFTAFALVAPRTVTLFADPDKFSATLRTKLTTDGIVIEPYQAVFSALKTLKSKSTLLISPEQTPKAVFDALPSDCIKIDSELPIPMMKAVKNKTEIAMLRKAMIQDGIILSLFFHTLETMIAENEKLTEYDAANLMTAIRKTYSKDNSFEPITAYNANAAQCHYKAKEVSAAQLKRKGLLLVDSGSQYLGATTDVTRTVALGPVTAQMIHDYTLVLKGHLALSRAVFSASANGAQLDALVRAEMWKEGIDFGHGTGHGVGSYLGVHEGPHGISGGSRCRFVPGMIVTNEPGIYRSGKHGIRIENILLVVKDRKTEFGQFLRFEDLTLYPYDTRLIDLTRLTRTEILQINAYHQRIAERVKIPVPPPLPC